LRIVLNDCGEWKTKHKKGIFIIMEYQSEYAVAISSNKKGEDRAYGIKGISNSVANILPQKQPVQIETVLLPFKGNIVYDTIIATMPIEFEEGAKALLRDIYGRALKHGIITSLE
jgi:hypothetical protein